MRLPIWPDTLTCGQPLVHRRPNTTGNGRSIRNTVPSPRLPPASVVPYSLVPLNTRHADASAPSVPLNCLSTVKPVPLVSSLNTVPESELPPAEVVP